MGGTGISDIKITSISLLNKLCGVTFGLDHF